MLTELTNDTIPNNKTIIQNEVIIVFPMCLSFFELFNLSYIFFNSDNSVEPVDAIDKIVRCTILLFLSYF